MRAHANLPGVFVFDVQHMSIRAANFDEHVPHSLETEPEFPNCLLTSFPDPFPIIWDNYHSIKRYFGDRPKGNTPLQSDLFGAVAKEGSSIACTTTLVRLFQREL